MDKIGHYEYKDAINKLNGLTSNVADQKNARYTRLAARKAKMENNLTYLSRTGIKPEDLKQLSVIHIAGTKGKGSTSAMCESILRNHGYKTGLYTSPHLISVTERIKINGKSINEDYFSNVFHEVYEDLHNNKEHDQDMPAYFAFLTVMALKVFILEKVDVAVIEVGIGGRYDSTNIVNNVPVVGISSLGLDHTTLLGNKIEDIAYQKAGIMKTGCIAYTVPQPLTAHKVLCDVARDINCTLNVVPDYESYLWTDIPDETLKKLDNPTKYLNASLAIQLSHSWMNQKNIKVSDYDKNLNRKIDTDITVDIPMKTLHGIKSTVWPGRCQIMNTESADVYIDGAHTIESMELCANWFKGLYRDKSYKVLIFYITKERKPLALLKILLDLKFDMALFVPNIALDKTIIIDQMDMTITTEEKLDVCLENSRIWSQLVSEKQNTSKSSTSVSNRVETFSNVSSALNHITDYCAKHNCERPQVLITGSLLLVGAALAVLERTTIQS